jgi:hypothetical protein
MDRYLFAALTIASTSRRVTSPSQMTMRSVSEELGGKTGEALGATAPAAYSCLRVGRALIDTGGRAGIYFMFSVFRDDGWCWWWYGARTGWRGGGIDAMTSSGWLRAHTRRDSRSKGEKLGLAYHGLELNSPRLD